MRHRTTMMLRFSRSRHLQASRGVMGAGKAAKATAKACNKGGTPANKQKAGAKGLQGAIGEAKKMKLDTIATTHRAETLLNNINTDAQWKFFKPAENHLDLLNAKHAIADKV